MAKYVTLWKLVEHRMSAKPEERIAGTLALIDMVNSDFKGGMLKEWGAFVGENRGYAVIEGTAQEVTQFLMKYGPYVNFQVRQLLSIEQVEENYKAAAQA